MKINFSIELTNEELNNINLETIIKSLKNEINSLNVNISQPQSFNIVTDDMDTYNCYLKDKMKSFGYKKIADLYNCTYDNIVYRSKHLNSSQTDIFVKIHEIINCPLYILDSNNEILCTISNIDDLTSFIIPLSKNLNRAKLVKKYNLNPGIFYVLDKVFSTNTLFILLKELNLYIAS